MLSLLSATQSFLMTPKGVAPSTRTVAPVMQMGTGMATLLFGHRGSKQFGRVVHPESSGQDVQQLGKEKLTLSQAWTADAEMAGKTQVRPPPARLVRMCWY